MATVEQQGSLYDGYAPPENEHLAKGYDQSSQYGAAHLEPAVQTDFTNAQGAPQNASPLSQSMPFREGTVSDHHPSSTADGYAESDVRRMDSVSSQSHTLTPSRAGTLKKKQSLSRKSSLKRSGSRRSTYAGSVRSLALGEKEKYGAGVEDEMNSAFYTPVPTHGNPTDVLAARFQAWRKVLKDLITYFRDIQKTYEARSKTLLTVSNVINNSSMPPVFLADGGIGEATRILREYHRQSLNENNKARDIENDVIIQLSGLRSDLSQKIKEIKNLSGDFKNSVDKEMETTRKAARSLQESLGLVDEDPAATTGKGDPFLVKITVDEQVARQIEEENYLHRAFLNLENSGRELESIVVGEIQKAYNALAGILKREADEAYDSVEKLRSGPISMPKDLEWSFFVERDDNFVDPKIPLRSPEHIHYPGRDHPAAAEVRSGMLERKSKYLKSYTPGWYVLSPTHLHEFKSPERIGPKTLVMSLYLPEQKLGAHSQPGSSSHKFMLKGRQTGAMHRGHAWVFRAESHETMLAWYEDIKNLTEKSGEERNAFVTRHARSLSGRSVSRAGSLSSEGAMEEDEADETPYSANASLANRVPEEAMVQQRPSPGGRFPSDIQVNRDLQVPVPLSPSSHASSGDPDAVAAAGALPGSAMEQMQPSNNAQAQAQAQVHMPTNSDRPIPSQQPKSEQAGDRDPSVNNNYGDWVPSAGYFESHQDAKDTTGGEAVVAGPAGGVPVIHAPRKAPNLEGTSENEANQQSQINGFVQVDQQNLHPISGVDVQTNRVVSHNLHVPGEFPQTPAA